ncbi:MAG: hypothetical protein AAFV87_18895 [Pseudomonadota bacterium]
MSFHLADFSVSLLSDSIEASFAAERGPAYDALLALIGFAAYDLGRQAADPDSVSDDEVVQQLADAYKKQLDRAHAKKFDFDGIYASAKQRYGSPTAVVADLQRVLPDLAHDQSDKSATPTPKPGFFKRLLAGGAEVGSRDELISMAKQGLFFASYVYDDESDYPELERPIEIMMDDLPE